MSEIIKLERYIDAERPCCDNYARILPSTGGPHAAELRCAKCGNHRGWLPKEALDTITRVSGLFGAPAQTSVLRSSKLIIGKRKIEMFDNTNTGALFKADTDRDYGGTLNVGGVEYWVSGWIKTSKKGQKFLSLSIKPKNETGGGRKADDMNDAIPFGWR